MLLLLSFLACSGPPEVVALKDAPTVDAKRIEIVSGQVDLLRLAGHSANCKGRGLVTSRGASPCVESDTYVAPIVDGHASDSRVHAWVTCSGRETKDEKVCRAQLQGITKVRGTVVWRVGSDVSTVWGDAVQSSGLDSVVGAPVLRIDIN
jgi:hypothetical protein